jgi:hypothetical protein
MNNIPIQGGLASFQQPFAESVVALSQNVAAKSAAQSVVSDLEVVANPVTQPASSQIPSKGVVIQGSFVPLELPDDVSLGERVDVKQILVAGEVRYEYLALSDTHSETESSTSNSLKALLQTLKINDESLKVLRQLLGTINSSTPLAANGKLVLADTLVQLLVANGVPQGNLSTQSTQIKDSILTPANQQLRDLLTQTLKSRDHAEKISSNEQFLEKARLVINEIKALGIAGKVALTPLSIDKQAISFPLELAPELKELLQKLTQLSGTQDPAAREIIAEFKKLVASQIETLPVFESRIKALLLDAFSSDGALPGLMKLLQKITLSDDSSGTTLKDFAKKLLVNIERVIQKTANKTELRQVLKDGLQELYKEFNLAPFDKSSAVQVTQPHQVNLHIKGTLRLIENQLTILIASPDLEKELESLSNGVIKQAPRLEALRASLKELLDKQGTLLPEPLRVEVEQKLKELEVLFTSVKSSPDSARRLLLGLRDAIITKAAGEIQLNAHQETLVQLNAAITQIIDDLELADHTTDTRPSNTLPITHKLKELLKNIATDFPLMNDSQGDALLSETYQVIDQLERLTEREVVPAQIKQQLQSLLTKYQQLIEKMTTSAERENGLHLVDRDTLSQVSTMLSSQETLQRFAPLVKAMGEPVFMLFPLLFGNILSQAQLTYRNGGPLLDQRGGHQADSGAELFQRLQISIPLPHLGEVAINIAYRKGELLLNILVQSKNAVDVIERRLPELRKIFCALGYFKNQIEIAYTSLEFAGQSNPLMISEQGVIARAVRYQAQG